MARKPIEIERAGLQTPGERVWAAIRKFGKLRTFTLLELQDTATPLVHWETVDSYAGDLRRAGYIELVAPVARANARFGQARYRLVKDTFDAPRFARDGGPATQGLATLAMWRAMKALKEFDYHDIQRAANVGDLCRVSPGTAKSYVALLSRAGYYRTVRAAKPGTPARYRLVRDTGAHAPAITRRKAVFDRNTGQFTWQQSEQEVCDGLA